MAESVVVTGASKGIGEACAARLVGMGVRVYAGVRDAAAGEALRRRLGEALVPIRLDVTDATQIEAARARVETDLGEGGLRGLVNNAGIAVGGPLELVATADLRRQLEVNVIGQLSVTRAFLPLLRRRSRADETGLPGRIVLMGSIAGRSAVPFMGAYAASKHALEAVADALRLELRSSGISVSIVEPGMIATSIWDTSLASAATRLADIDEDARRRYGSAIDRVMGRARRGPVAGLPADRVAQVVAHALTASRPRARYLVGRDARVRLALERLLPTRVRDRLLARQLGL